MNYLKEILTFENWLDYNSTINKSDIRLWYTLMYTANRFNWKEFSISISSLIFKSKLSKSDIYRSRNKLKQVGLIDFKEKKGNQCTVYKINSCVDVFGTQNGTDFGTELETPFATNCDTPFDTNQGNINKTKNININKNKNKKEIVKEKFGEFENVLLSADELQKLKSKFGDETENYIERLSSYIASSGKRYKSHYATILSWSQKDSKNSGGLSYGSHSKKQARQLCTEYPE